MRSILEQSCAIWHSSLTEVNITDLECLQKNAFRTILGNLYSDYTESQNILQLENLTKRTEKLSLKFAMICQNNPKTKELFPLKEQNHDMKTRNTEKYKVTFANTERLRRSAVPYLQNLLNKNEMGK